MQTKLNEFNGVQDWVSYNKAQTQEKELLVEIVNELLDYVQFTSSRKKTNVGRSAFHKRDMLFCCIMKTYLTFSSRRTISDLKFFEKMKYISKAPHFNSVLNYFGNPFFEDCLKDLIVLSSLPLHQVEDKFAVDASGFGLPQYERWSKVRADGKYIHKTYKKVHVISGVKTNIITSVEVTHGTANDSPYFDDLVKNTASNFRIKEVSADKAYSSRKNLNTVASVGGLAFIPFKKHALGRARGSYQWMKMYKYFTENRDEFMKHYHLRSNAESVFSMIKRKFGESLRTKKDQAQINEILLKCLCHNICVLIQESFERGVDLDFNKCARVTSAQKWFD